MMHNATKVNAKDAREYSNTRVNPKHWTVHSKLVALARTHVSLPGRHICWRVFAHVRVCVQHTFCSAPLMPPEAALEFAAS